MPTAKGLFLERISSLSRSAEIDAVTNRVFTEKEHNDVARMLRNGLSVVGFAALEDFVKTRTSEVLGDIGRTTVPFGDLPEKLRNAATFEAISALSYQLSIRQKADRTLYIQEQAAKLASTASPAYDLTPHAFGFDQANLQEETIKAILKCFLINDPWGEMTRLASRMGLVALPLEETYKNAARRRHRAAHVAHADTPQNDLIQFVKEAYAIAISFDALLSKAFDCLRRRNLRYLNGQESINSSTIKIRSIRSDRGVWKEFVEGRNSAVKVERDILLLAPQAITRAASSNNLFVQFDINGGVVSWECN
ncbi:MAG: hypothetical protein K0Q68_2591 [Moraxellaceae bacterium]|jgi:hypothetical protein|nr:hypothetical protein [Moraxellaceae bacterium]